MLTTRNGCQPSPKGAADYFTGSVRIDSRFQGSPPARVGGAIVTFEPGARTAWHTHPLGQTLIVTSGVGWIQAEGGLREEIRPGDIVWFPPGQKHWHGATATTAMTHIAIAEALDGKSVDWLEQVSEEQYGPDSWQLGRCPTALPQGSPAREPRRGKSSLERTQKADRDPGPVGHLPKRQPCARRRSLTRSPSIASSACWCLDLLLSVRKAVFN
jgi:quercetin dioxygenase-like cupin family protein